MRVYVAIILSLFLVSCNKVSECTSPELIAHAGGGIEGFVYTNSREALEKSIADGYRYIEFDLVLTADSVLVAAHDWEEFNSITGLEHNGDTAPAFSDFLQRRIYNRYTPLSAQDINAVFESDTTLILVTDKISSPYLLARNFPNLKRRMVVEAFSYDDYNLLRSQGYMNVLYSCMAHDIESAIVKHLFLHPFFEGYKIEWIAMSIKYLDNLLFRLIDALFSLNFAMFTVNDYEDIPPRYRNATKMIYTDYIKPKADE